MSTRRSHNQAELKRRKTVRIKKIIALTEFGPNKLPLRPVEALRTFGGKTRRSTRKRQDLLDNTSVDFKTSFGQIEADIPLPPFVSIPEVHLSTPYDKYYEFQGSAAVSDGWISLLQTTFGNDSFCTWDALGIWSPFRFFQRKETVPNDIMGPDVDLEVDARVIYAMESCKSRFIIGILLISVTNGDDDSYHANTVIIDRVRCEMIRFEPHGGENSNMYNTVVLDDLLHFWLRVNGRRFGCEKWTYSGPKTFCPLFGPQHYENDMDNETKMTVSKNHTEGFVESNGYCQAWSLMYLHLRLLNPDYADAHIIAHIMNHKNKGTLIRKYAEGMMGILDPFWRQDEAATIFKVGDYVRVSMYPDPTKARLPDFEGRVLDIDTNSEHDFMTIWSVWRRDKRNSFGHNTVGILDTSRITDMESKQRIDRLIEEQSPKMLTILELYETNRQHDITKKTAYEQRLEDSYYKLRHIFENSNTL